MLRSSTARLLAARPAPRMARPISRTAPTFIRIKKADGSTSKPDDVNAPKSTPPPPKPEAPQQPSPAEQPSSIPKDVKSPPPFEPEVRSAASPDVRGAGEPAPEVTQGTPSEPPPPVEAEEIPDKPDLSKLPSLDIDPEANVPFIEQPKEGKEKDGDKKKKAGGKKRPEYVSSIERQRRFMTRLGMASLLLGGLGAAYYLGNQEGKEKGGNPLENFKNNLGELTDIFSKPAFTKLLPDPLPPPHQRPYTLLVDIEDMLVHST
jgi:import inner membrane translocase subunit TIM50